jgi:SAM-dependent methyltransferase
VPTSIAILQTTLKLLSDPTRLRLVALLSQEELAVHELMSITGLAQSRISNHLSLLKRAGIVRDRKDGNWSFHRVEPPTDAGPLTPSIFVAAVEPWLQSPAWHQDEVALDRIREQRRERSRAAHDRLAERWVERGQEFATGSLRADAYAALVPPGLRVADLGCGAGYLTEYLVLQGAHVIAVDHSSAMLDAASRRLREGVEFRRGELDRLPLADGEVDAAFANLVWHHLPALDAGAAELARAIRPGGTAVLTDLLPHDEEWMREEMGDLRLGLKPDMVVGSLSRAGFVDVTTRVLDDRYVVESKDGRKASLPLFLVRARRAHPNS